MKYDVVVVGAGPVGSTAARYAALNGAKVLLIEEHASIGSPVGCTGLLSTRAVAECELKPAEDFVFNSVRGAFVYAPDGQCLPIDGKQTKAYVVSRKNFDRKLAEMAVDKGVDLSLKTRAIGLERKENPKSQIQGSSNSQVELKVIKNGKEETIETSVIIGADGVKSRISSYAGLGKPARLLPGIQIEAPYASEDSDFVELFPGSCAPGFFAWTVPTGEKISRIGLALEPEIISKNCKNLGTSGTISSPLSYLEKFLRSNSHVKARYSGGMLDFVVGGIPIGPAERTFSDGVLIVGDAAGQAKPTSGGGVYTGAFAAKIAGKIAANAALEGDTSANRLSEYDFLWSKGLGKELDIGMKIHDYMGKLEDKQLNELIGSFNNPSILKTITEYGDMDHPSVLVKKLMFSGNSLRLMKAFGTFLKTLF
ncbi:MAG: geranylgeranyl reductase family protein [Methanosarcina sp.]